MRLSRVAGIVSIVAVLPTLLASCGLVGPPPYLGVSTNAIHMVADTASFTISNISTLAGPLNFVIRSSDPNVVVHPTSGSLGKSTDMLVTVSLDPAAVAPGTNLNAVLHVTSNGGSGGSANVAVDHGIGTCGAYAPRPLSLPAVANASRAPEPSSFQRPPDPASVVPGQIVVGYRAPAAAQALATWAVRAEALRQTGLQVRRAYGLSLLAGGAGTGPDLVQAADVGRALTSLRSDPRVRYAQANRRVRPLLVPDDPYYPPTPGFYPAGQWNLTGFGMEQAWNVSTGASSRPVVIGIIGIIDTGVDTSHPDLVNKLVSGWDFASDDPDPSPGPGPTYSETQAHGTHVAGIAAAQGNNGRGVTGVAFDPNVKILPLKIFDDTATQATVYELVRAVRWAAGYPDAQVTPNVVPQIADVLTMSIGMEGDQPALDAATQDAWDHGVLLVAAAGNHGTWTNVPDDPGVLSPANAPCVMAVGSVDSPFTLSDFSNTGPQLEVVAPGGHHDPADFYSEPIVSTVPPSTYGPDVGTSMAAPFVAGVAALLKAQDPSRTPAQLRDIIDGSSLRATWMTDTSAYGYGEVCADRALDPASPTRCGPSAP